MNGITLATWVGQLSSGLPLNMSFPLWGLVVFILWTISIVLLLLAVRIQHLAAGGSPKDFGTPNEDSLLWRLFRIQSNLVENLPLYLGVVMLLLVREVSGTASDILVIIYITFRILHSLIHLIGADPKLRILSLMVQFSCLISLTSIAVLKATP